MSVDPDQFLNFNEFNKHRLSKFVRSFVENYINILEQELIGENDESFYNLLRNFRSKISRKAWLKSQKWCKWEKDGPVLMPDYSRLYYRKGKTEIIVQEFPPQVRLLKMDAALNSIKQTEFVEERNLEIKNYSLALPYVVFIFEFVDGMFVKAKVAFSDRPLKTLEEIPLRPYLSNIDLDLILCLGTDFHREFLEKGNLVQQVALILNYFWQSVFSDEWSTNYWSLKSYFQEIGDQRLCSFETWQESSFQNSLFVIEDVDWLPSSAGSFGDIIVKILENDSDNIKFKQEIYDELSDEFIKIIEGSIKTSLGFVREKVMNENFEELLKEIDIS